MDVAHVDLRRCCTSTTSRLLLWLLLTCIVSLPPVHFVGAAESLAPSASPSQLPSASRPPPAAAVRSLASLCNTTSNAAACLTTLSQFHSANKRHPYASLHELTAYVVSCALIAVNETYNIGNNLTSSSSTSKDKGDFSDDATLQDCMDLLDDARGELQNSIDQLLHLTQQATTPGDSTRQPVDTVRSQLMNVRVWLSASFTDADTCWDELADDPSLKAQLHGIGEKIEPLLDMGLSFAQILQQDDGASSTVYALPASSDRRHGHHHHHHHRRHRRQHS